MTDIPACLVFSGHDPSGGAGIQADIEALASMGAHAMTVVTALTVQDSGDVYAVEAVSSSLLIQQARALIEDAQPSAIKIGLVPDVEVIQAIHSILTDLPSIPVVLDPVIWAGGGSKMQDDEASDALSTLIFPLATVITPNQHEARVFAPCADVVDACGISILESGCDYVLITGGDADNGDQVTNRLYGNNRRLDTFEWPRLPHRYHGSGCTLASAIAGLLSHGREPHSAIREAQQYTWDTLKQASRIGNKQLLPNRFFWTDQSS